MTLKFLDEQVISDYFNSDLIKMGAVNAVKLMALEKSGFINIFERPEYIERRGSGLKKILEDYNNHFNNLVPEFVLDNSSFILILKNIHYDNFKAGPVIVLIS